MRIEKNKNKNRRIAKYKSKDEEQAKYEEKICLKDKK